VGSSRSPSSVCSREGAWSFFLEARELLVAEVLDLVSKSSGISLSGIDDVVRPLLCRLHDLGSLHHSLGAGASLINDVVGLVAGTGEKLLPFLEQPTGRPKLLRKRLERLVDEDEHLVLRDHRRCRERNVTRVLDHVAQREQDVLGLGRVVLRSDGRRREIDIDVVIVECGIVVVTHDPYFS